MTVYVNGGEHDVVALQARLAAAEALVARMKASATRKLSLKVSKAGAVSMYGMGRWPVTLYRGQWERVLEAKDEILAFIADHADQLSVKE